MASLRARLPLLLLVALGLLVAVWYYNLEWEEKEIDRGPSPEARRNPVLALQRLLEARDQSVQLVRGFAGLERLQFTDTPVGPRDALVLLNTGRSLRQSQIDQLWQWMENGGRLLVTVDNPHFDMAALDNDPLLDKLELELVGRYWTELDEDPHDAEPDEAENSEKDENAEQTTDQETATEECLWRDVTLPVSLDSQTDLQMEFVSGVSFADLGSQARVLAGHGDKRFLVHQSVGAGGIYAIPAMQALTNNNIHCADNAYVVWRILRDSDKVWLVLNADSPNFWRHLWHLSALGCIALLTALVLGLWHTVPRFGPVLARHTQGRRQFLDHIQASAQFLLRKQGTDALITPLREEILQKLRRRHPGFPQLSIDDQIAQAAQLSGMSHADVQLALYRPLPVPDSVFIDMVQRLQHLRNAL